ncbi:S66 peptidase family protein [Paractinoplanes atraurantiacus]|uniref:Muramoyltetrapeptide carboxypeptidase n=1 Tax=Paractinoplanes atraurantiacus TaxID=1036182 RepID=A0A285KQM3_9ACTN|nr:LD-carboxypeptidase [Actinoplanes atraurantiacus]SNY74964.1 muramoyltetrapeptide carboxypeptidase [Actinoplanes atraurantiacus]
MIQAQRLVAGDLVALVSPSGAIDPARTEAAISALEKWGLRARVGANAHSRHGNLAGTDEQRLSDLNAALRDPAVRAILCLRGGYGMQRIVDAVDFDAVRADPKLIAGFSDITALHLALWHETGLATVHGPTAGQLDRGPDTPSAQALRQALMTSTPVQVVADKAEDTFPVRVPGTAEGTLLGGNLAMLTSTIGTPHAPDTTGAILLLEDVNEEPYRVDRMLVHLRRAGWLDNLAGVAVGQFTDCTDPDPSPPVIDYLSAELGRLGIPVLGGLPIGHGAEQIAIGLGVHAHLNATAGVLTVSAPAV